MGGEFYFSDIYSDRRLNDQIKQHEILVGECLGGALYSRDFEQICKDVGFVARLYEVSHTVAPPEEKLAKILGEAVFVSCVYRLFKLKDFEKTEEYYGDKVCYQGSIKGHENKYQLDNMNHFPIKQFVRVSHNTALILKNSWLSDHFVFLMQIYKLIMKVLLCPLSKIKKTGGLINEDRDNGLLAASKIHLMST
eukprot:UN34502